MFRTTLRAAAVTLVAVVPALAAAVVPAHADYQPPMALLGDGGTPIPLKNAAMIVTTEGGYRYIAGQQNSRLTVTYQEDGTLRYADTGTRELREIPGTCSRRTVATGIAAVCTVPEGFDETNRMYLEVWPRLGNDYVDGSSLPGKFRMWVLADAGFDTVLTGAGDDFVNGAQDGDVVDGGDGNDWIRTGIGDDVITGGAGNDKLVGVDGKDTIRGGEGDDRLYGGPGSDQLFTEAGKDLAACAGGVDRAYVDSLDKTTYCETVDRG